MELAEIYEIQRVFKKYKINEVYNLAAQSFVGTSFSSPLNTANITGLGTLRILETIRSVNKNIKFYQASSSEMFGDVLEKKKKRQLLLILKVLTQFQKFFHITLLKIIETHIICLLHLEFYLIMSLL